MNRSRSVFPTILLSYFSVVLIVILIGSVLFQRVENVMIENANRANLGLLEQVRKVVEGQVSDIERLAAQITLHPELPALMNSRQQTVEDQFQLMDFMKQLRNYRNARNQDINFYIYFTESNTILTPSMKADPELFFEYIQIYEDRDMDWIFNTMFSGVHQRAYFTTTPVRRGSVVKSNLSFLQSLPMHEKSNIQAYLVIHFDEGQIEDMLQQVEWVNGGYVYILDHNHDVVMSNLGESRQTLDLDLPDSVGYQDIYYEDEDMIMSYTTSAMGWKYVSIAPRDEVLASVTEMKNLAIFILIVCLLIGIAAASYMAYRNYRPIRRMINVIEQDPSQEKAEILLNEFDRIKQTVLRSRDEKEHMKQTLDEQIPVVKSNYLNRLLKGYADVDHAAGVSFSFMGVEFQHDYFSVLIISIDDCTKFILGDTEKEWALVRYIVSNLGEDLLQGNVEIIEMDRDRLAVLGNLPDDGLETATQWEESIHHLKNILEQRFRIESTFAVSKINHGAAKISASYREAMEALDYRMIIGRNEVILYRTLDTMKQETYHYPLDTEVQLMNLVMSGDLDKVNTVLDHLYQVNFNEHRLSPEMGKCLFLDLAGTVLKLVSRFSTESHNIFEHEDEPVKLISESGTIEEMYENTKRMYEHLCQLAQSSKSDHSEQLFRKITDYIQKHYHDSQISLAAMADHLGITPQYLSNFFKKHSGGSMTDYIAEVRMKEAKTMLEDPENTISFIAEKIGYATDVSFIRFFKKQEGITPGKYRKTLVHKADDQQ